ncbi:DNA alkylation repair protein [Streptomyces sp. NPDC014676]|uniref:DNA alkylation repair protein n=1 Tax=Streptomyces sp. NPDC014676 TaxID=3364879 RepID=UPI003702FE99
MGVTDDLVSSALVARLRTYVTRMVASSSIDALNDAEKAVTGKKLRERVDIVRDALLQDLPEDFAITEKIARGLLEEPNFSGWMIWPASEWVARRGLESGTTADFDATMDLLAALTVRLSSEFAVREPLNARPERALEIMKTWTQHPDLHVRRLASEGSRAYLPWGRRVPFLITHPKSTQAIIDALYRDESDFVRRSAANHLNDLSRVAPDLVTRLASRWAEDPDANTPWVIRHGLRTLIKKGNPEALELVGFTGSDLTVGQPSVSRPSVPWNGSVSFNATITNNGESEARVAIDYSLGFQRANGTISPKTFKLAARRIPPGQSVVVEKTHSFRPITTRTYYPGEHFVTVQANGVVSSEAPFTLEPETPAEEETSTTMSRGGTSHG